MNREFLVSVPHLKGGGVLFGILLRMIPWIESRTTKLLDSVALIISYFKKRRVGVFYMYYTGILI